MSETTRRIDHHDDGSRSSAGDPSAYDVAIVGGGPASCSAGVFCARSGLDTVIFDRGRSSIRRCAHLENYPGSPAGIDVETFHDLIHDHAERAGCEIRSDLVEAVVRRENGGFVVETDENDRTNAHRIDSRSTAGATAPASHVDPEVAVEAIGEDRLLEAIDDESTVEHAASHESETR